MQNTKGLLSVLGMSNVYSLLQSFVCSRKSVQIIVDNYIKPFKGCSILDIGCGPADILGYMPEQINYYGFDLSHEYIQTAKNNYGDRGHFFCASVTDEINLPDMQFDIVIMLGVLHHLSDEEVKKILEFIHPRLKVSGRLITLDPCFVESQSYISRFLVQHDRGCNVRNPEQYSILVESLFSVNGIHTNFNRIPYDHWLMECTSKNS